ncbi:glycosyltransferase family 25 protein [Alginatibacterium sediminis]|uniref:Glycosyltransferase family 25 protein n=1 Tax=Alginatibacterium sediminis TaxID=2164068 RepID=A0A420E701_9ALTE|nr:glycosyltransferase family 25 protein [Alginatibacterium sediminis]RKF14387.1 glycosyltransferase family 25 protein [Alginatibacterium sediminis]
MNLEVLIIALEDSVRRANYNDFPLPFRFLNAVRGNPQNEFDNYVCQLTYGRKARDGEMGCTLSHVKAAREFIASSGFQWCLILEDDAKLEDDALDSISAFESIESDDPLIYLLGHSKTDASNLTVQRLVQPFYSTHSIGTHQFGTNGANRCGTVSYVMNRAAAELLARSPSIFWITDDWQILKNMGIKVFHPKKPIVYEQVDGQSSTGNSVFIEHDFWKRPLLLSLVIVREQAKYWLYRAGLKMPYQKKYL